MDQFANAAAAIQASVDQNNAWSAQQAQKQMDFQREMSNTAHQREIADLKAAGLNPVLSAKLGGASTPSGAMATGDTSGTSALVDLLQLAMQTANSAASAAASSSGMLGSDNSSKPLFDGHVTFDGSDDAKKALKNGSETIAKGILTGNLKTISRGFWQIVTGVGPDAIKKLQDPKTTESFKAQMEDVAPLMLGVVSDATNGSSAKNSSSTNYITKKMILDNMFGDKKAGSHSHTSGKFDYSGKHTSGKF